MRPGHAFTIVTGVVTLFAGALSLGTPANAAGMGATAAGQAAAGRVGATATAGSGAPTTPPAMICDNHSVLDGPASQPAGSVRVDPTTNLYDATQANPPGTTFWLAPGTFTLADDQFSQIVPRDGDTYIGAPGAILDGRGLNRYAFTSTATGVTIRYLTIQGFVSPNNESVVNHDSGPNWTIEYTTIRNNKGGGVAMGTNNVIRYSCLTNNGQYGFTAFSPGTVNLTLDHTEISYNDADDIEMSDPSCGCSGGGKFFNVRQAVVTNNWVHHNKAQGLFADTNAVGFLIEGNYINDNTSEGIVYETSYNAYIHNNTLIRNALRKGATFAARNDTFPITAIYIQESGGDARVNNGVYSTFEISGNHLEDNWGGVTLWENADRFCNTVGSTAAGFCPIAGAATVDTCVAGTINTAPYLSDCRWKTQNVSVHDNDFIIDKYAINCTNNCGQQGLFSNVGSYPPWSPYQGNVVQNAVTYNQNNHFNHNNYIGDWHFDSYTPGNVLPFTGWQATPSLQDINSTFVPGIPNALDTDTATLEGSIGHWVPWFSTSPQQTTETAHSGTHALKVNITAPSGWGVQLNNAPGFDAYAGQKTISFWGKLGTGANLGTTLTVHWRNLAGSDIRVDTISLPTLTSTWANATAAVVAPVGTAKVSVEATSSPGAAGVAGNSIYLDDIVVADSNLDSATSGLESSVGQWVSWFSATPSRVTTAAHSGTHALKVAITAPFGWGVQLNNSPGFAAIPGRKVISFWGLLGSGAGLGATMHVHWRNAAGTELQTDDISLTSLTTTWQQVSANVVAPAGTAFVSVDFTHASGKKGNSLYLDDIVVASGNLSPTPPPPPSPSLLDANTAGLESTTGHWVPWFSTTIARTTTVAHSGTASLEVDVSAPAGWGIQLDNAPGFAATPGPKTIGFSGGAGTTTARGATMTVRWRNAAGADLQVDTVDIAVLTAAWQQVSANVTAPAGTANVSISVANSHGGTGAIIYLDDFVVNNA